MQNYPEVLSHWGIDPSSVTLHRFGSGHIHETFLVIRNEQPVYILQKLNTRIFKEPETISANIRGVASYLNREYPHYLFPGAIPTHEGLEPLKKEGETWRLTAFIANSYSPDELTRPELAFEAAAAFGKLTRLLNDIPMEGFVETIPYFHDLSFRFQQFNKALTAAIPDRLKLAKEQLIEYYLQNDFLVKAFDQLHINGVLPRRIQHHDTKINNVLFDKETHRAVAVCDLDTLMPGYFISDLGDMIRTYTSAENEESTDWEKIRVRPEFLKALKAGYLSEMEPFLTANEKLHLFYAGEFMIYMQGLRFLTDFLNGDTYYPVKHANHNLNRARNQMLLLESYREVSV